MKLSKPRKTILVDFDGVLHGYQSGWKGPDVIPDPPVPGAIEWLREMLADSRFEIAIYSSRSLSHVGVDAMRDWLVRHGISEVNRLSFPRLSFPLEKPAAHLTIDDRAICFDGRFPTLDEIDAFVPWHKK